jgi:hypothetical protein
MIRILGNKNMRQQAWTSQTAGNRTARSFRLHDGVTSGAAQFRPYMPDDFETGWHILEHFRAIFPELTQAAAAGRTGFLLWFVQLHFTGKMIRQGTACRLACHSRKGRSGCGRKRLFSLFALFRIARLQVFQLQFELFNRALSFPTCVQTAAVAAGR